MVAFAVAVPDCVALLASRRHDEEDDDEIAVAEPLTLSVCVYVPVALVL